MFGNVNFCGFKNVVGLGKELISFGNFVVALGVNAYMKTFIPIWNDWNNGFKGVV